MSKNNLITVAFYNIENLFDTINDPNTLDDDFTGDGRLEWDEVRYLNKIFKLSKAISKIGSEETENAPILVGLAEVENKKVLNDLIATDGLKETGYGYVHRNSPDERGIDTALLYKKGSFEVLEVETITLLVNNPDGQRDFTRDILYVRGALLGEEVHIYVNHWPSRREGSESTSYKRIAAAKTLVEHLERVKLNYPEGKFIIMGDFNDDPTSESINNYLMTRDLFNPMRSMLIPGKTGSLTHNFRWNLFDQIIVSNNLLDLSSSDLTFVKSEILSERFLEDWDKKYEGFPFRTFAGSKYLGGYSDHFPVYVILKRETPSD